MKKRLIVTFVFLSVILIFVTGFSSIAQKQIRYILEEIGVETDDEHFYLGGIPISYDIFKYNSDLNELEINSDNIDDDTRKYLKIHENPTDEWSLEQWHEVRELTHSANARIIKANLNGIKSTVTFSQKVSKDELDKFINSYGLKKYRYKAVNCPCNDGELYYYGVGLLIKDSRTLEVVEKDERVFMVDTFGDFYHIGRNQSNEIERNGTDVDQDYINEWGKELCIAMQREKN